MNILFRNGARILMAAAIIIFLISVVGVLAIDDQQLGMQPSSAPRWMTFLSAVGTGLTASVWAFGLACIVHHLAGRKERGE